MIELEDVVKSYPGHRALDGICLNVPAGRVYALLGPNGAGKSTTINLITGLLRPTSGSIRVDGIDPVAEPEQARSRLAFVPDSVALYPFLSGMENLQIFSRLAGRRLSKTEAGECLERAGLQRDAHTRRVGAYSKGMRQKVGLAIALAKDAKAVVLDEPSSGLDPSASHNLSERVRGIADQGLAVLMATHDLFRARDMCDSVGLLVNGKIKAEWDAADIEARELQAAYLDIVTGEAARPVEGEVA